MGDVVIIHYVSDAFPSLFDIIIVLSKVICIIFFLAVLNFLVNLISE